MRVKDNPYPAEVTGSQESLFMKSPVSGTTEHRRSPGTTASAGRHPSRPPRVSTGTSVLLICLAAALVLIPAAAADTGSVPDNGSAAGNFPTVNISIVNTSTEVGNVSPALNVSTADNISRNAPAETTPPATTISPAATVSNATNVSEEPAAQDSEVDELMGLGGRCYVRHNYDCAWDYFETARLKYPSEIGPVYMQCLIQAAKGNITGAIDKIDVALVIAPDNPDAWKLKGDLLNRAGRYTESGACYDQAIALDPEIRVATTDRFPYNMGMKNLVLITIVVGFCGLGIYVYFREFHE
jgi:hypothetical protein